MLRSFFANVWRFRRGVLVAMLIGIGLVGAPALSQAGTCGCLCSGPGGSTAPGGSACSTDLDCSYTACRTYCSAFGQFTPGTAPNGQRVYTCVGGVDIDGGLTQDEQRRLEQVTNSNQTQTQTTPGSAGARSATAPAAAPTGQQPRGTCSFSCGSATVAARAVTVNIPCSTNQDCQAACTNRCPVPGPNERDAQGRPSNGLATNADGLTCAETPTPRCVFPAGTDAPAGADSATAVSSGNGGMRFVLPSCTEDGNCSLTDIINTAIRAANFLLALSGLVFLATVLWAGAQLIFFAQDAKSIGKAQGMLVSASIAMIIIMVAGVAVRFVSSGLQVTPSLLQTPGRSSRTPRAPRTTNADTAPTPQPTPTR